MNISTISLLIKRQFKENYRIYGIGLLVLIALLLFMFLLVHQWQDSFAGAVQNGVFIIGLFIAGGIFSNSMFHEFSNPQSGMWLLSIPATHSEKVLTSIIISVVFFLLIYFPTFYLADILYLLVTGKIGMEAILNPFKDGFYQFIFFYFLFNGIILLGSVIFGKHSFIKTLLAAIVLMVTLNYINTLILQSLIPEASIVSSTAFDSFLFRHEGENIKVSLFGSSDVISSVFVRFVIPISIWFTVWLKLKEKQI
ncbi:hypothetical protein OD91_0247 [Lutibacter sp. Hel_I_33_5]|uniref:hypothetical protein n=1 Tax=Lutibacter sp. Hel_I_33_5 TaxID=1566289 RepID=UPI0011A33896|nr:hypothetical protein [Lutibacter sp. Hel_I_33_5]TVZ55006.1 hypothetical protein OD91_0247 [Lutibacter sp. Hel_I_33_5]